ncbi:ABC transporter substrate-binding protein [Rhizobium sp. RU36D]|uniref:ABC transporter substrate-binding protein n=1 Tax=Rhizobium sp. RU36D TaxID=1907415 RepID=UPI0009D8B8AE|nr:ABC transporter substrate-binding protein [Rhizobium sp. RU36D]SMC98318.1 amino acid/amide ABC transporter substrate-binding protein, HAAT family [Rhizobium sp. RU36D]
MKRTARLLATLALPMFLAGPLHAENTIKIGNIVATAGPLKSVGEPAVVAADIAVAEINAAGGINGKKVELIRFDTGSDPKQAAVGTRKLVQDDGVLAILGPFSSGESAVAFNDADRLKVLMIPNAASAPGLTDNRAYAWRLTEDEPKQFTRLLTSMKAHGIKMDTAEIVYISEEAVSNASGTKLYPAIFAKFGIKHGEPIAVQYKSFDMSAQAAKILQSNPDMVAIAGLQESASKVIKELRRQGYKGRIIGSQIFADPTVVELFGPEGEGTMMVAGFWKGRTDKSMAFDAKYLEETKKRGIHKLGAHHSDAQTYDALFLMKQVMEKAGVTGDPSKLEAEREAVAKGMEGVTFSGILGDNLCFVGHDAELPGYIIEIKGGQWTKFDEAPADKCN